MGRWQQRGCSPQVLLHSVVDLSCAVLVCGCAKSSSGLFWGAFASAPPAAKPGQCLLRCPGPWVHHGRVTKCCISGGHRVSGCAAAERRCSALAREGKAGLKVLDPACDGNCPANSLVTGVAGRRSSQGWGLGHHAVGPAQLPPSLPKRTCPDTFPLISSPAGLVPAHLILRQVTS